MADSLIAQTVHLTGAGGDDVEAYLARPLESNSRGGVVVIHHMPGFDRWSHEVTRRFAATGYDAICPNLHYRDAPGAAPDDAAAASRANGGVPDDRLVGDVGAAVEHLRGLPESNGKVGVIGYCSGGRQSVLAACRLPVDAAVDCYGAFVTEPVPEQYGLKVGGLVPLLGDLRAPLLGLFGAEDRHPAPEHVAELDRLLTEHGKEHEFHSYDGAGHAFFDTDRPAYRPAAALDGWARVTALFADRLA